MSEPFEIHANMLTLAWISKIDEYHITSDEKEKLIPRVQEDIDLIGFYNCGTVKYAQIIDMEINRLRQNE